MPSRRPAVALVAALSSLASGCSLILGFDPIDDGGGGQIDAQLPGDGGGSGDGGGASFDAGPDPYEPNDSLATATLLAPGSYPGLAIQPASDHDFFRFTLDAPRDVTIEILFTQARGDLDLRLYDAAGNPIGASTGYVDNEAIRKTTAEGGQIGPGEFIAEVYSFQAQYMNTYTLNLTVM